MKFDALQFKKLDLSGVEQLIQWAILEGWNSGPNDAAAFYAADPDGFYGFFKGDEMIAGGSIVSYDGTMGFMGLFIVQPAYRSLGIGKELWYKRRDTLLQRLDKGAPIGMDGVVAMQPFYQKGGFEIAFKDERYERKGTTFEKHPNITSIESSDIDTIISYDASCFGVPRAQFLRSWLQIPNSVTFKYVDGEQLKGYTMIRKATIGYKICPLFADTPEIAEELYKACLTAVNGALIYIDIPTINKDAVRLVEKYEAKYVFECARMYYGTPPQMETTKVFGITTFELG